MALTQITSDVISSNAISATMIANGSITSAHVSNGAISSAHHDVATSNGTGAILVPTGSSAQRPAAVTAGYIRFNTTLGSLESANGTAWANVGSGSSSTYDANTISVGYFAIPQGTIAQRPANPPLGAQRWNTSNGCYEVYTSNGWYIVAGGYTISYLVAAGGGGGGAFYGGGGGAGGLLTGNFQVTVGVAYSISIGAGGAGQAGSGQGSTGTNSVLSSSTSLGGGGGGGNGLVGVSGGSGGGGGGPTGSIAGGSGTAGQGNEMHLEIEDFLDKK